jgi:hypothetical protein
MKVTVWVVSTCIPDENEPCMPNVFGTEKEAQAYLASMINDEWEANPVEDDDSTLVPMPEDPVETEEALAGYLGPEYGRWEITSHTVEIPDPKYFVVTRLLEGKVKLFARVFLSEEAAEAAIKTDMEEETLHARVTTTRSTKPLSTR